MPETSIKILQIFSAMKTRDVIVLLKLSVLLFALNVVVISNAQNVAITDDDDYTPYENAMLDVYSQNKGMLVPRVALQDADNPIYGEKQNGLLVWNTYTGGSYAYTGFYFWNGEDWERVGSSLIFENGLTKSGEYVKLGGSLNQNTTINLGNYNMNFNMDRSGTFNVMDDGTSTFKVDANGNVGIHTDAPTQALEVAGNFKLGDNVQIEGNTSYGVYRNLATYSLNSNTAEGAIVINTKQPLSVSNMFMIKISGYFYSSAGPFELTIKGYHYNNNFNNLGYTSVGPDDLQVRVGKNADGNLAIILGDEADSYTYPKVTVTYYYSGYTAPTDAYADGWTITQETSLGSYSYINEVPNATTVANYYDKDYIDELESAINDEDLWNRSGSYTYLKNSTDKLGIGTNTPLGNVHIRATNNNTTGTDGALLDIQNYSSSTNVMSGLRFNNGTTMAPKAGIFFQDKTLYNRGNLIFANQSEANWDYVTAADARMIIDYNGDVGIGNTSPTSRLTVQGNSSGLVDDPLFEVKNNDGQTVFAVYNEGVRIWVDDNTGKALGSRGGFAVGGFSSGKSETNEFLRVTPDSVRVYIQADDEKAAGSRGGFAVGGFSSGKNTQFDLMSLTKSNYFIGHESGLNSTGLYNLFLGYQAGKFNVAGSQNLFIGYKAGLVNTSGYNNVFIGKEAGTNNELGFSNVFVGYKSGYNNIGDGGGFNGTYNVMIGPLAGFSNQSGGGHVIMGYEAAQNIVDANYMTAIGYRAAAEATGGYNVFIGGEAGKQFGAGEYNTCVGMSAAVIGSGNYNSYFGARSGWFNEGDQNVAVGYMAGYGTNNYAYNNSVSIGAYSGYSITSGNNNTFLGHSAGKSVTTGEGNVFLGYNAGKNVNVSNKLYIENSDSDNPLIYGDFNYDKVKFNANVGVGYDAYSSYGLVVKGGSSNSLKVYSNTGQTYALYVSGAAYSTGGFTGSDIRLKKDVREISGFLDKVMALKPVTYFWRVDEFKDWGFTRDKQVGLIAQEVEKVIPLVVSEDEEGYKAIDYSKLSVYLIGAMQQQQNEIEQLKQKLSAKKLEINNLKAQVEKIESIEKQLELINQQLNLKAVNQ